MKKMLIVLITLFLTLGCALEEKTELSTYEKYIKELKKIDESSKDIPFDIEIKIAKITEDYYTYIALIKRNELEMNEIEALLIHNIESENEFPSLGILDEKVSLKKDDTKLGIKLTGYIEEETDIVFKLMIKYKDKDKKDQKYYYIYKYRQ